MSQRPDAQDDAHEAGPVYVYVDRTAIQKCAERQQYVLPAINVRPFDETGHGQFRLFKCTELEILDDHGKVVARVRHVLSYEERPPGAAAQVFIEADHVRSASPDFGPWQTRG